MHNKIISKKTGINENQVSAVLTLLREGATIPFISRYRKERTGGLDEVGIAQIVEAEAELCKIDERKTTILKTVDRQGKLTDELRKRIDECYSSAELEDIYLPYKPKRRTRAARAGEKGLEPLAEWLMLQQNGDPEIKAADYLNDQVGSIDDALAGARDIIAEIVGENQTVRHKVRRLFEKEAVIRSSAVKDKRDEGSKYSDYFELSEPLNRCPSHRFLAVMRGVSEGILKVSAVPDRAKGIETAKSTVVRGRSLAAMQVATAVEDAYKRLIEPSMETETINAAKEKADEHAIKIFADNLVQLLLASPLGEKNVLAIDPGYRTGCKTVCLDKQGNLLHNETIFPHPPQGEFSKAGRKLVSLVDAYKIEAIAIGDGTASRETERFVKKQTFSHPVQVFVVNEDGASIYSVSPAAREEFPQYDVTVRGAISVGRRLMDPLSELVKIDPKSIGVGQYQHDVDQNKLKAGLDRVVESCVNKAGVNLNTASKYILAYIAGLGNQSAQNIVNYRNENGPFRSRSELLKVPRLGPKAFEQCAGFLRIIDGTEPLDNSAVHPESYEIVRQMAKDSGRSVVDLIKNPDLQKNIDINKYITDNVGLPTLTDIMNELAKPGADPRSPAEVFEFADVSAPEDLKPGMILPGIVTNITAFGAFVDVGVKQDGLVHISQMADKFVSDPNEIVKLNQHIKVKVLETDIPRKRISLSMKLQ